MSASCSCTVASVFAVSARRRRRTSARPASSRGFGGIDASARALRADSRSISDCSLRTLSCRRVIAATPRFRRSALSARRFAGACDRLFSPATPGSRWKPGSSEPVRPVVSPACRPCSPDLPRCVPAGRPRPLARRRRARTAMRSRSSAARSRRSAAGSPSFTSPWCRPAGTARSGDCPGRPALLAARLDALDPVVRRLVADAAVLGFTFPAEALMGSAGRTQGCCGRLWRTWCAGRCSPCPPTGCPPSRAAKAPPRMSCARSPTTPCRAVTARHAT